jgi:hypothetical protein
MGYSREEQEGRALAYVASIFFSLGLAVFAVAVFGSRQLLKSERSSWAANWPTASGQITTCDVKAVHGRFLDYALGVIGSSYRIDGNYDSGYLTRQFFDEQRAWTFVDACKDKLILVPYKLGNPQMSVLREMDLTNALPAPWHRYGRPHQRFGPILAILWPLRSVSDWAENGLHKEARNWPSVPGSVEYAEPMLVGEDNDAHWGGDLHYSYSVDGNSYSDSYYFRASTEQDARNQVEQWRSRKIIVHYFPGNQARSVFISEEQDLSAATVTGS